ncbi:MAG TPA: cell wall-binding repeat-containing protein [Solirubrobacteraceae bacterium]
MPRRPAGLLVLSACLALTACGGGGGGGGGSPAPFVSGGGGEHGHSAAPAKASEPKATVQLGFPAFATKNTTRIGGSDAVVDAAGAALAVFPSASPATRPPAVALADVNDWRAATAAAALMAPPVRAPLLLSDGSSLPAATSTALAELGPKGSGDAGGSQIVAVGATPPEPKGQRTTRISGGSKDPAALAAAVDRFLTAAKGKPSPDVVVVGSALAPFGVPAAAWAAKSGDPVLFTDRDSVPSATLNALRTHAHPRIFVLGPPSSVGPKAMAALGKLGAVVRIAGADPVRNAIAFARYRSGAFGWGIVDPGHGLVVASAARPLDGPASAALSSSGDYGPLLLVSGAEKLPAPLQSFLLDIQPGFRTDPVRGVYNRAWVIGDADVISVAAQARLDQLLEIAPVDQSAR